MGTAYNGKAGNESRAAAVNIASSTNASPIAITTATPHGLMTGDRVEIINHATNTAANGAWSVTVTGASAFTLDTSTGTGAGGATGTVQYLGLMPRVTLPDDGVDLRTASALNVPNSDAKDSQAWLAERVGAYRLVQDIEQHIAGTPDTLTANASTAVGSWGYDSIGGLFGSGSVDVQNLDIVEITVTGTIKVAGATSKVALRPSYELADYGAAFTGTTTPLSGAGAQMFVTPAAGAAYFPVCLHARGAVSATRGKKLKPCVDNYGVTAGPPIYQWYGDVCFHVRVWRKN